MFEPTSRYFDLETATLMDADGRDVPYGRRRLIPAVTGETVVAEHRVAEGERLDHITARYLGDPELFWQLCDVNGTLHPAELTAEIGRRIRIALLPG